MDDTVIIIFALETYNITPTQSDCDANVSEDIPQTLKELITAQFTNEIYQNDARKGGRAGTKFPRNKEEALTRRTTVDGALQYLVCSLIDNTS